MATYVNNTRKFLISRGQAIANQIRTANPQLAEQLGVASNPFGNGPPGSNPFGDGNAGGDQNPSNQGNGNNL